MCQWLAQQSPGTTTVLMVGRHFASEVRGGMGFWPHRILPKPFVTARIDREVRRIMALVFRRAAEKTWRP
jgi:hypothetical protein